MSFLRHGQIYHPMCCSVQAGAKPLQAPPRVSSSDESATGYSLASCTPALLASASPAVSILPFDQPKPSTTTSPRAGEFSTGIMGNFQPVLTHRGSAGFARQPGLLPVSPPQTSTHHANPVGAHSVRASARMMENQTARLAARMISPAPTTQPPNTPSAWMMTLCSAFLFPVPIAGWVISIKRYWVILAERRSHTWILSRGSAQPVSRRRTLASYQIQPARVEDRLLKRFAFGVFLLNETEHHDNVAHNIPTRLTTPEEAHEARRAMIQRAVEPQQLHRKQRRIRSVV